MIYPPLHDLPPRTGAPFLPLNDSVAAPSVFTGIFSAAECDRIMELGTRAPQFAGRMTYAQHDRIKTRVAWLAVRSETQWLYEKLWRILTSVNRWYAFALAGMVDELQFTTYRTGDRIDWHLDTGTGQTSTRKLSLTVQLSDGNDYRGGNLEFAGRADLDDARGRGTVIFFPSFLAHRVTPVTSGSRFSLVAWAHGSPFT